MCHHYVGQLHSIAVMLALFYNEDAVTDQLNDPIALKSVQLDAKCDPLLAVTIKNAYLGRRLAMTMRATNEYLVEFVQRNYSR